MRRIRTVLAVVAAALILTACNNSKEEAVNNGEIEMTSAVTEESEGISTVESEAAEGLTEAATDVVETENVQVILDEYNTWPQMLRYGDNLYILGGTQSWGSEYSLKLESEKGEPVEVGKELGSVIDCGANAIPDENMGINFYSNSGNMTMYEGLYNGEVCFYAKLQRGRWAKYDILDTRQINADGAVNISDVIANEMIEHFLYVEDVKVIKTIDNRMFLEKAGKAYEVEWAYVVSGTGEWTSGQLVDVNKDGEKELILFPHIRETSPVFIYDFANEQDLSPYFCKNTDIWEGVFWKPEYAGSLVSAIDEGVAEYGYGKRKILEDGTWESTAIRCIYGEESILNENGGITLRTGFSSLFAGEWWCYMELSFNDEGCNIEITEVGNRYKKYQDMIDIVTENSLAASVKHEDGSYPFLFEKDNVAVSFSPDLNHAMVDIQITYDGVECDNEWVFTSEYDKCYFELYDYDSDGMNELIYHTVEAGEETVRGYDFKLMCEIYINGDGTEQVVIPEKPEYDNAQLFTNKEEERSFEYRYNPEINSWDEVFTVEDVCLVHQPKTGKFFIEYDGKREEVSWAVAAPETGKNMSFEKEDVTGDGEEDFLLFTSYNSSRVVFIYDMAHDKDLSPYYGVTDCIRDGLYLYEEYAMPVAEMINMEYMETGYSVVQLEEDNSLNIFNFCTYVGDDVASIFQDGGFKLEYYKGASSDREWSYIMHFSLADGELVMEGGSYSTRYSSFKYRIGAKTEYTMDGIVEYEIRDGNGVYKFTFEKDEVRVYFEIKSNDNKVELSVTYMDEPLGVDFDIPAYGIEQIYFELYDEDSDGKTELVCNLLKNGEMTVQIYDFDEDITKYRIEKLPYMLMYDDILYTVYAVDAWRSWAGVEQEIEAGNIAYDKELGEFKPCISNTMPDKNYEVNFSTGKVNIYSVTCNGEKCFILEDAYNNCVMYKVIKEQAIEQGEKVAFSDTVSNQRIRYIEYVDKVAVIKTVDNRVILEKDGKGYEVEWPYVADGTGEGTSGELVDVNGDGVEELILFPYIRETHPVFIYDFANERDLSPYFCKEGSIWGGVFWYPEYASQIIEPLKVCLETDGYACPKLLEDGTLNSGYYTIKCTYGEDSVLNENGGISLRFYFFSLFDYEWWCDMELTFDEEGCRMELVEVSNRYRRYQEVIDTVTEHSMPGEVIFDSEKWEYSFRFEKDDVVVSFLTDLNHANANISITYDGKECEQDWMFLSTYSECYFELYDQDNDGKQELIYHQIKSDEETIQVYNLQ